MSTLSKRLDKVEEGLSSFEVFLTWMDDVHEEHPSLGSYVESVADEIDIAAPLPGLVAQLETSVRSTSRGKGLRPPQVQEEIERATWEVAVLYHLHLQTNVQFLRERRALWLSLAHAARDCADVFGAETPDPKAVKRAHDCLIVCVLPILEWDQAVYQVAEKYFGEDPLLFPDASEELGSLLRAAILCGQLFTQGAALLAPVPKGKRGSKPSSPLAVDLDSLIGQAEDGADARAERLLDLARAEAWQLTGERKRATERLVAHARPSGTDREPAPPAPPSPGTLLAGGPASVGTPRHSIFLKFLHEANRARVQGEAAAASEVRLDFVGRLLGRGPQRAASTSIHNPGVGVNIYLPSRDIR